RPGRGGPVVPARLGPRGSVEAARGEGRVPALPGRLARVRPFASVGADAAPRAGGGRTRMIWRVDLARALFRGLLGGLLILVVLNGWASLTSSNRTRVVEGTDAGQYDKLARGLEADRGFSSAGPPFDPTFYREPGYPLFLALAYRLSNDNLDATAAAQVTVLALSAGITAALGARLFGPLAGLSAGALLG